jgi:hypothetical protein
MVISSKFSLMKLSRNYKPTKKIQKMIANANSLSINKK